ncbi:hypothetical protein EDD29_5836 [Actinocorallia herbida]|uniref:Uncharacterized protein n=1 Tax=Actinocorallia herbida TaxID=58109 RepID=A0A3N1D3R3_9ACTN|nr:hypothetical protein [Actinocorallia herbida]ROO88174.1 hypothetical protein EDD29_5836 [Actinocorallia herbida]
MVGWLAGALIAVTLAVAVWFLLLSRADKMIQAVHLLVMAVLEVGLLAQVVVAAVRLTGGHEPAEQATFIGYLIGSLVVLPVGAFLAVGERSKWGTVAAAVACLTVPVVILRMQELWSVTGV